MTARPPRQPDPRLVGYLEPRWCGGWWGMVATVAIAAAAGLIWWLT